MAVGKKGKNLIFLISQPRAGSTLLQQVLSNHAEIFTLPEPWIALPYAYALHSKKIDPLYHLEYSRYWARSAIADFIKRLPGKEEDYLFGLRLMFEHWYNCALAGSGKQFFLDKCPRYYHILPELYKVFPEADFIFLFRSPLAVLNSILDVCGGKKASLREFRHDLLSAPRRMIEGIELIKERCIVVKYEDFLANPGKETERICLKLNIIFDQSILQYKFNEEFRESYGFCMQPQRYRSGMPDAGNAARWRDKLQDRQRWRFSNDYLNYLGEDVVGRMGYQFSWLKEQLQDAKPGYLRRIMTVPLLRSLKGE